MSLFKFLKKNKLNYEEQLFNNNVVDNFKGNIKILVIADTHGDLFLSSELQSKLKNIKEYDICCILGDIHEKDYQIILNLVPKNKIVSLLGNHDKENLISDLGLNNLNGNVIEINGIRIGGIQGSHKYKDEEFPSFTHQESIKFCKKMSKVDILISHDKPFVFDYHDSVHDGLKGITKYLYKNNVPINIHGHVHKSYESNLMNGTKVIGVYLIEVIEIFDGNIKKIS